MELYSWLLSSNYALSGAFPPFIAYIYFFPISYYSLAIILVWLLLLLHPCCSHLQGFPYRIHTSLGLTFPIVYSKWYLVFQSALSSILIKKIVSWLKNLCLFSFRVGSWAIVMTLSGNLFYVYILFFLIFLFYYSVIWFFHLFYTCFW